MNTIDQVGSNSFLHGILLSIAASLIGGISKLCIRKSYLLETGSFAVHHDDEANGKSDDPQYCNPNIDIDTEACERCDQDKVSSRFYKIFLFFCMMGSAVIDILKSLITLDKNKIFIYFLRSSGMIGMTILNPLCGALAMNYASPSVLAPFSGLTLVWIVLLSEQTIGERPRNVQIIAVLMVVIGQVVIAIFGDHTNIDVLTIKEVRAQYTDPSFLLFFAGMTVWFLILIALVHSSPPCWTRFAWGVSGGCVTGFLCFIKDAIALSSGLNGDPLPYDLLLLWFCAAIFPFIGLILLMMCIKRYDVTYSSSMFVVGLVCTASLMAAVHYHTFEHLTSRLNFSMYFVGILVLIVGAILLAVEEHLKIYFWRRRRLTEYHIDTEVVSMRPLNNQGLPLENYTKKLSYTSF